MENDFYHIAKELQNQSRQHLADQGMRIGIFAIFLAVVPPLSFFLEMTFSHDLLLDLGKHTPSLDKIFFEAIPKAIRGKFICCRILWSFWLQVIQLSWKCWWHVFHRLKRHKTSKTTCMLSTWSFSPPSHTS